MSVNAIRAIGTQGFFYALTRYPRVVLSIGVLAILLTCTGVAQLVKDTSVDAFIPPDHPSIIANEEARERFGLSDPIVVALSAFDNIFAPPNLTSIAALHEAIAALPNVRADRVMSLYSESSITGFEDRIEVSRYLDDQADLPSIAERWRNMPPHVGTLVSADGRAAVIIVELIDQGLAGDTYGAIQELLRNQPLPGLQAHIAGQGAVVGHLSSTIDSDSRLLQPLIFLTVLLVLFLAFRTRVAVGLPLLVIIGSAGGAIGIMAYQGAAYFAITSALPVILVAVAVADTIHILTAYYVRRAKAPDAPLRPLIVETMSDMLGPITVTTLTTMAGFIGIALAEIMPPIVYFAAYAALGVGLAWVYSILLLPNIMLLVRPRPSHLFQAWSGTRTDRIAHGFTRIGLAVAKRPLTTVGTAAMVIAAAGYGASHLRVDRALVEGFKASSDIRQADEYINKTFAGTSFLDVIVRADSPEGLLDANAMTRISKLQAYMETLPRMQHTMAITDYISLLHQAIELSPAAAGQRPLPSNDDAIAQYLLVYEASGDPTDFEEEIDGSYQHALVRGVLNTRYFSEERQAVEKLEQYLQTEFNGDGLTASLAGRVNVRYHWMVRLAEHHALGVGLSLLLVFAIAAMLFRSVPAGALSVLPVSVTVLGLYGIMGTFDIYLEPATTMFAAISLGVGVDFAIHLVARLRRAMRQTGGDVTSSIKLAMPETGRACFFNALALGAGFSVLLFSELLTLKRFGGMVAVAATLSFVAALVLIPAIYALGTRIRAWRMQRLLKRAAVAGVLVTVAIAGVSLGAKPAQAQTLNGQAIAQRMAQRPDGDYVVRQINMSMTDRRGHTRSREALILRSETEQERRTLIVYLGPKSVRETAFLGYDYHAAGKRDDQWLYLPAMRKIRRIPSSDRGDYFLGTDFTYEDMQSELKFDLDDYDFHSDGLTADGSAHHLQGTPKTPEVARELGYGGFSAQIDPVSWIPTRIEFHDRKQQPLKTVVVRKQDQIDGIWTALDIQASNHQNGHVTRFVYADIRYPAQLPDELFVANSLRRGVPRL